jgi:succinate-semialdehyde dehydrogenase/glutarate-semialdehyde dehydrogenase
MKRAAIIGQIGDLIAEQRDPLARLITLEVGKPLDQATGEVQATIDVAFMRANSLEFGLTACVFTNSLKRTYESADAIQAGVVGVNTYVAAMAETPFGGVKQSGFGREGSFLAIRDYLGSKFTNMVFLS